MKSKYLHVELPSLHLAWERSGEETVLCSAIRTNYPKPSTLLVPAIMRQSGLVDIEAVDMKIRDQDNIVPYREFKYGNGKMVASRKGMNFEALEDKVKEAHYIGLSVNPSSWFNIAKDFAAYAKKVNRWAQLFVGGSDATFRPEAYVKAGFDVVFLGEGETTGPKVMQLSHELQLVQAYNDGMEGIVLGDHLASTRKFNPPKISRGTDLNKSPLQALDLMLNDMPLWNAPVDGPLPKGVKAPIAYLELTRGCNQSCDFCTTPQKYGGLRFKSLERLDKELDQFRQYGINTICIWDDSLGSLVKRGQRELLLDYIRLIKQKGFAFEYAQGMVIKDLWNPREDKPDAELIEELFSHQIMVNGNWVGCYGEYFPTEFLQVENPTDNCEKLMSYDRELEVLKAQLSLGIKRVTFSCILGNEKDSKTEFDLAQRRLQEMTALIRSYGCGGGATPFIYSFFPGSRLWKQSQFNVEYSIEEFPELYQLNASPHGNRFFSAAEITAKKIELEKALYPPGLFKERISTGHYWGSLPARE